MDTQTRKIMNLFDSESIPCYYDRDTDCVVVTLQYADGEVENIPVYNIRQAYDILGG